MHCTLQAEPEVEGLQAAGAFMRHSRHSWFCKVNKKLGAFACLFVCFLCFALRLWFVRPPEGRGKFPLEKNTLLFYFLKKKEEKKNYN